MPTANLDRRFQPTLPLDTDDPFRFGQLIETSKDCFQRELFLFFQMLVERYPERKSIVPTIEKYGRTGLEGETTIESALAVLLQRPDILEKLPLIIITAATGNQFPLGFGSQYVDSILPPARVSIPLPGPFVLPEGGKLAFRTFPRGFKGPSTVSEIIFSAKQGLHLNNVTSAQLLAQVQVQAQRVKGDIRLHTEPLGALRFYPNPGAPNSIEILGAPYSTPAVLTALGFTDPLPKNDSRAYGPLLRYQMAKNLTINIDIGAEDENQRREIGDLVDYFLQLDMDDRGKTFFGRSVFDIEFPDPENFQVILLEKAAISGEVEVPRTPGSGEAKDLIYALRMSIPITIIDYNDREIVGTARRGDELLLHRSRHNDIELPAGDHKEQGDTSG